MSWLEAKLALGPRPYPVAPLAERLGYATDDPFLTGKLARDLDMNLGWVRRCRRLGLTTEQADRWACKAGVNPGEVWPTWYSDLRGVALVAANRLACGCGEPFDRVDSRGKRYHAACARLRVVRYRERMNTQVSTAVTARAPLGLFTPVMAERHGNRERLNTNLPVDVSRRIDELRTAAGLSRSAWACMVLSEAVRRLDAETAGELEAAS